MEEMNNKINDEVIVEVIEDADLENIEEVLEEKYGSNVKYLVVGTAVLVIAAVVEAKTGFIRNGIKKVLNAPKKVIGKIKKSDANDVSESDVTEAEVEEN